jgi:peptide/nickel transport system permease protein
MAVTDRTAAASVPGAPPLLPSGRGVRAVPAWLGSWLRSDKRALIGVGFVLLVIVAALVARYVAQDPIAQHLENILEGPSKDHWLGTDDLGRDVFSRLLNGGLTSLGAAAIGVVTALVIGVPLGLIAGFRGGLVDEVVMRVADTVLAFPALVLAVGVVAMLGPGLTNAMIAVGVVFSPSLARLMRAQVLSVKEQLYVEAAVTFGSSAPAVVRRHVIPNAIQPVVVQTSLLFAIALIAEAGLSFIGLGVQPPHPSWGSMLGRAYKFMNLAPLQVVAPGVMVMLTALAFNAIGDSLRDELDPRRRRRRRGRGALGPQPDIAPPEPEPLTGGPLS